MPTHLNPSGGKRMPEKSRKEKLAAGELVLCMNLRLARSVDIAMVAKAGGYDALYVDMQHAPYSIETTATIATGAEVAAHAADVGSPDDAARLIEVTVAAYMGRLGTAEEVADVIVFIASPRAHWINAEIFRWMVWSSRTRRSTAGPIRLSHSEARCRLDRCDVDDNERRVASHHSEWGK
jgi:hypothetical protein